MRYGERLKFHFYNVWIFKSVLWPGRRTRRRRRWRWGWVHRKICPQPPFARELCFMSCDCRISAFVCVRMCLFVFACVCVCVPRLRVCVCVWEREREKDQARSQRMMQLQLQNIFGTFLSKSVSTTLKELDVIDGRPF